MEFYELRPMDKRMNVEGRLQAVLSKYGGKRIVGGKDMANLLKDLTNEVFALKKEGVLDD